MSGEWNQRVLRKERYSDPLPLPLPLAAEAGPDSLNSFNDDYDDAYDPFSPSAFYPYNDPSYKQVHC